MVDIKKTIIVCSLFSLFSISLYGGDRSFVLLDNVRAMLYFSSNNSFIPFSQGNGLKKGLNFYLYGSGYFNLFNNFSTNYTIKQTINRDLLKTEVDKLYLNYKSNIFSITFGKTSRSIGISENSLILSENAPPFLLLDIEILKPLKLFGEWKFEILNGWLDEKRIDRSNTRILILRIDYSPSQLISLGLNRYEQYGGTGRPAYKIWELPILLWSSEDNISYSKYDGDGYMGIDVTLHLDKHLTNFDKFKIYFQEIGTDVMAPWQKEDKGQFYFPFIIKLLNISYQTGIAIQKNKDIFNFEFTSIHHYFYTHHLYPIEGYSYEGFSLGVPYGNNLLELYFNYKRIFEGDSYVRGEVGFVKQPVEFLGIYQKPLEPKTSKRYYLEIEYSNVQNNFTILPYIRIEYFDNYDDDLRPMQYDIKDINKLNFIIGLSTKVKL